MFGTIYAIKFWTPRADLAKGPSRSHRPWGAAIYGAARAITALFLSLFEVAAACPAPAPNLQNRRAKATHNPPKATKVSNHTDFCGCVCRVSNGSHGPGGRKAWRHFPATLASS